MNIRMLDFNYKEDMVTVPNQTDLWLSLFFLLYEALCSRVIILGIERQQTLEKGRSSWAIFYAVPTEIFNCSEISSIVGQNKDID